MSKKQQQPDALIGRRVRINEDGTVRPGTEGTVVRSHKDRGYEVDFGGDGSNFWYQMAEFTVLANEATGAHGSQLVEADPYLVAFSLTNPRKRKGLDIESLSALAASIKAIGLGQPPTVRPLPGSRTADTFTDRGEGNPLPIYELVCGERRLRACRIAGLPTMPLLVRDLTDSQALELQLVENIEREDLDPMEEAEGFEQLRVKCGYTVEQIADHIAQGKGASYVYKSMKLLDLTPESREAMYEGHLGRSTGLLVARYPADLQSAVVAYITSMATKGEPAPYRVVAPQVFKRFNLELAKAVWDIADASLVEAAGACTACPKRTGANADLFGDDTAAPESCTDPDCFEQKREAHVERTKAQAAKDGLKVITGDEARVAVPSPHQQWINGYARLTDLAYVEEGNDGVERKVTFEDALRSMGKKAPKPRILINPHTGKAEKVITEELADKLTPDTKPPAAADAFDRTFKRGKHDDRPEEEQALDDGNVRRAVLIRMFDAIRNRDRTDGDMLLITKALFACLDEPLPTLERYLSWEPDLEGKENEDCFAIINAKLEAMRPEELAATLTMAAAEVAMYAIEFSYVTRSDMAARFGIDILAVRDKVAEDLEKQDAIGEEAEEAAEASA